jgi:dimethylhistidine N-methyltransferase
MSERSYTVLSSSSEEEFRWTFAAELRAGFAAKLKWIHSKWIYDPEGSELFDRIMRLEEYTPSTSEREIFDTYGSTLMEQVGQGPINLVDLGAGDGTKTDVLLRALLEMNADVVYVPIDISETAVRSLTERLNADMPALRVEGLVSEYVAGLRWLKEHKQERNNVVLFLGSNIGNFAPDDALMFFSRLRSGMRQGDRALIGFDLKKDVAVIERAYADPEGVTAAFNLNLLKRINREFDADFDLDAWQHHAVYNPVKGAAESYLISLVEQDVHIRDLRLVVHFDEFEPIHTEYSHKYLRSDITAYAEQSGFRVERVLEDKRGWFADALWRVA